VPTDPAAGPATGPPIDPAADAPTGPPAGLPTGLGSLAGPPTRRPAGLGSLTSAEVAGRLLVVPVGSTEQHGPHLPLSTDTDVAVALATRLAARVDGVLVAPPVPYGSSGEHAGFPGTLSIGAAATELVLVELGRSAVPATVARMLLLSAHGGNAEPVSAAVRLLRSEGRDVRAWSPRWDGDAHAGRTETSVQLALDPARVRPSTVVGNTAPLAELLPALRAGGVRSVSPTGVLGDPTGASAAEGAALLDAATADLVAFVERW
jgi:mycofactocin precursor peptide peptidase